MDMTSRRIGFWDFDQRGRDAVDVSWTEIGTVEAGWQVQEASDYDGNGTDDILWRHSGSGEVGFWSMQGGHIAGWTPLGFIPPEWQVS